MVTRTTKTSGYVEQRKGNQFKGTITGQMSDTKIIKHPYETMAEKEFMKIC